MVGTGKIDLYERITLLKDRFCLPQHEDPKLWAITQCQITFAPNRVIKNIFPFLGQIRFFDQPGVVGHAPMTKINTDPKTIRIFPALGRILPVWNVADIVQGICLLIFGEKSSNAGDNITEDPSPLKGYEGFYGPTLLVGTGKIDLYERITLLKRSKPHSLLFRAPRGRPDLDHPFLFRSLYHFLGNLELFIDTIQNRWLEFELLQHLLAGFGQGIG